MAKLDVHVVTPTSEIWAGEATFVVARSEGGEIGVLPGHEPVLAKLKPGPFKIELPGGGTETGTIDNGFLSVGPVEDGVTRVDLLAEHVER